MKLIKFTLLFFFALIAQNTEAQIVINEFSAANRTTHFDNYGDQRDWIELYNIGTSTVDLSGYYLSDKIDNPTKWEIPNGASIEANGYFLVLASGLDEVSGGFYHASFKITQTKAEAVVLTNPSGTILDSYVIEVPNQTDHSYGRQPDGTGAWGVIRNPSPNISNPATFDHYAEEVIMSEEAGFYTSSLSISLSTPEPNAEIRYTLNGDDPDENSILYTGAIEINSTTVLRARTISNELDVIPGFIETNTYFINEDHSIKVISVCGSGVQDLLEGFQNNPVGSFELFEDDGTFLDEAVGEYNKHGNDSWAYDQRGIDYIVRDQYGYNDDIDDQIFDIKERNDYQRLIIKAAANDNYPFENGAHIRDAYVHTLSQVADMEMDERTWEPCVFYLNGQYWGVYDLREKVDDHDYTKEYYNQGRQWIDFIKTWGGTWEEYGSWDDWYDLHNYITTNDMSIPANYEVAAEQLEMQSLVDYMILNTHIVCQDWLNWNTAWWRGRKPDGEAKKWRYALWDMDASFGHYINYTGIPDSSPNADPCDNEEIGFGDPEGHVDLIISLLESEEFHSLYVNRYADLNNSFFSCDYMNGLLDEMIGKIAPEMPRQIDRWGGTMSGWEAAVQDLRDFIDSRCTVIDGGIVDCYEVEGPFPITVNVFPANSPNAVKVNTFIPTSYPFMGDYFGGTTLTFEAVPDELWSFDHWEVANAVFGPDDIALAIELSIAEDEEITAYFVPLELCGAPNMIENDSSFTSTIISWNGLSSSLSYELKYREFGSTDDWTIFNLVEEEKQIYGLTVCTTYEAEIRAVCATATSDIVAFDFETRCVSGVEDINSLLEFAAFPNPFTDNLSVDIVLSESQDAVLEVFSMNGQKIYRSNFDNLQIGQNRIPLELGSDLSNGTYLVKLTTANGGFTRKVIK